MTLLVSGLDSAQPLPALVMALVCGAFGAVAPVLVGRIPEPEPEPEPLPQPEPEQEPAGADAATTPDKLFSRTLPPAPPKEPYADIAARPRFGITVAAWSAAVGAVFGAVLGWTGALLFLAPLVPIGVVLLIIDWRTTLLPTRIIHPTYALMALLVPAAALVDRDLDSLVRAGWGWLIVGGWFWTFWFVTRGAGWGFGDVRLSRVLGPALGYLGWSEMLIGLFLIVLVGGIGGVVLAVVNRSLHKRVPYGPFMLVGAAVAVVAGPALAQGLGY
jgi:leader peptidase (prepilin peptidase)/N-methyltransferase